MDISTEMVDLMAASKAYQSNITVIQTAKTMAQAALQIGRIGTISNENRDDGRQPHFPVADLQSPVAIFRSGNTTG